MPRRELNRLDQIGTTIEIAEGDRIIRKATAGRECVVVVDGEFEVGGSGFVGAITSGEVAGELALLAGRRRTATVVASTRSVVYALHPREFATLLNDAPTLRSSVLKSASERLDGGAESLPAQLLPGHE